MNHSLFLISALAAGLTLSSCDTANQDASGVDTRQSLRGLAVDGKVAGGKVWVDMNDNLEVDDFEPFARTDNDGYYSYNPTTDINYCTLPSNDDQYKHCLVFGSTTDAMTIRISGGIDLATGEGLKGLMAMFSSISESSSIDELMLVLSPLTTVLAGIADPTELQTIKTALGIDSDDDLRTDFSKAEGANTKTKKLLANAVAMQSMMDVLSSATDSDSTLSESQIQAKIIKKVSASIISTRKAPIDFDTDTIKSLVAEVSTDATQQTNVSARMADLNKQNKIIETATTQSEIDGQIKASEVISQIVKREADQKGTASSKAAAKKILGAAGTGGGIETLSVKLAAKLTQLDSVAEEERVEFDISSITNTLVESSEAAGEAEWNIDEVDNAVDDSKLATNTQWGGNWFVLRATAEDSDELKAGSYVAVRMEGSADSTSGALAMCANASVADSTDPEEIFENEYFGGSWSKLNGGMVILYLDYNGQDLEGKIKAKVKETADAKQQYRLTSDVDGVSESGDMELDVNGVSSLVNVSKPTSSDDCANNVDTVL